MSRIELEAFSPHTWDNVFIAMAVGGTLLSLLITRFNVKEGVLFFRIKA